MRAEGGRQGRGESLTLTGLVPFVLSVVATLSAITFPFFGSLPLVGKPWAVQIARADQGATLGLLGALLETAIMMGILLWLARRVSLPPGTITLLFSMYSLLTMLTTLDPSDLP